MTILTASQVTAGMPIPPVTRLRLLDDKEWEQFLTEWQDQFIGKYTKVERLGSAGDQGRDVVCYTDHKDPNAPWDNFQCKYYDKPLAPSDIWVELGKLVYYTHIGAYTIPREYYFCAPRGVGTTLSNLLKRKIDLRKGLQDNWDKHCSSKIKKSDTPLTGGLAKYLASFDFGIIDHLTPMQLIDGHAKTKHHLGRFGGGLPPRPDPKAPTQAPAPNELPYVEQLFAAYAEHLKARVQDVNDISQQPIKDHFQRSRREFYCAESLREFSRDNLPPGEFERLQSELHGHVVDVADGPFEDGLARVRATTLAARGLSIDAHPLKDCTFPSDKSGMCHQLANDGRLKWVK